MVAVPVVAVAAVTVTPRADATASRVTPRSVTLVNDAFACVWGLLFTLCS